MQQARRDALADSEARAQAHDSNEETESSDSEDDDVAPASDASSDGGDFTEDTSDDENGYFSAEEETVEGQDPRAKVLSVLELEELFVKMAPDLSGGFVPA